MGGRGLVGSFASWRLRRGLGLRRFGLVIGQGFLGLDRIVVRLEERRHDSRNSDGHGDRIFTFVKLALAAIAATMAAFADVVHARVFRAEDAYVDGRLRTDGTGKHNTPST